MFVQLVSKLTAAPVFGVEYFSALPGDYVFDLCDSLFSGAGGMDIGADRARGARNGRIKTVASIDSDKRCCATLRGYFNDGRKIIDADLAHLSTNDLLNQLKPSKSGVDLIFGGPPCQTFSQAGKQQGTSDTRGGLITEFLRFVEDIRPPYFVMENVSNLRGVAGGRVLTEVLDEIDRLGYEVEAEILNATHYGAPQRRRRYFFLGSRRGLKKIRLPDSTHGNGNDLFGLRPVVTVGEAFSGLPPAEEVQD